MNNKGGIQKEIRRLQFGDLLSYMHRDIKGSEMVNVYQNKESPGGRSTFYAVIVPAEEVEEHLADPSWGFHIGEGTPYAYAKSNPMVR